MAGISPDFDAAAFRTAIQSLYTMAAPPNAADQLRFYFAPTLTYNTTAVDDIGVPLDPTASVQRTQKAPVSVPCGIEYKDGGNQQTVFGDVIPAVVHITVVDMDYEQIKDCAYIVLKGEKYTLTQVYPPQGLFDFGLYTLEFTTENAA